ncbi:hypothetical protein Pla108_31800 [Botrimarina colliarenosi]|uniref:Uncharacterized protein n=1 Tax=Botrimarina colliarenosi TaxID=2528001 RepID=A0A5C6A9V4_9BACT|nr:hypothetical protein [Botrimarina colliarenosi]TWT96098.1 hypothetical protein Pla108_31800 [Botrimarina colliarenosi]
MSADSPSSDRPARPPGAAVDALLTRLAEQLHRAIATRVGWQVLAAVTLVGWVALIVDRLFEPSATVRLVVELSLLAAGVGWLLLVAAPRLLRPIGPRDVVTLLHRDRPGEAALIATSLDLRAHDRGNRQLADAAIADADAVAAKLGDPRLVRPPSTTGAACFAAAAAAAALLLAASRPELAASYAKRVALSDAPWPRRVQLVVEGFERDAATNEWTRVVARGEPAEFIVVAEVEADDAPPETLWARGARATGQRSLTSLTRIGAPETGPVLRQRYRRRFERVDDDLALTVRGGDARLQLRLIAADRPALTDLTVRCEPPAYLDATPTSAGASTLQPLPEGSVARLIAGASKPLASVEATYRDGATPTETPLDARLESEGTRLVVATPPLSGSLVVTLTATDADGLTSEPIELPLEVALDSPPSVLLSLEGVGRSVTRDARLPVEIRLQDDHALADVRLELRRGDETIVLPLDPPATLPGRVAAEADLLSLRSADPRRRLTLDPGDRFTLVATAADRYDLAERPRAESRPIEIEVTTPAELLARLGDAQRELRGSLEAILSDVQRLEYQIDLRRRRAAEGQGDDGGRRWAAERQLDARKAANGVAEAAQRADGLRLQVVNNRLDQPDLVDRLKRRVVRPLRLVEEEQLAQSVKALQQIGEGTPDDSLAAALAGVRSAEAELERVLASLDTQQTYNEVVALLRGLIREQQRVNEKTSRQESESVRSLFD